MQESTLWSIQFTCVYLATKVVDRMPMLEMLRYILTHLYRYVLLLLLLLQVNGVLGLLRLMRAADVIAMCLTGPVAPVIAKDTLALYGRAAQPLQ